MPSALPRAVAHPQVPFKTSRPLDLRSSPILRKRRSFLLAGGVAVIAVAGALIGATLKSKQQVAEKGVVKEQARLDTTAQQELLETTRGQLLQQKLGSERKLEDLKMRREKSMQRQLERERLGSYGVEGGPGGDGR